MSIDRRPERAARIELAADLAQVAVARRFVREHADGAVDGEVVANATLAVSELVTNAIEHGTGEPIVVAVRLEPSEFDVCVESPGAAPAVGAADEWTIADGGDITGRGLGIVRAVADAVDVEALPDRLVTTVRFTR